EKILTAARLNVEKIDTLGPNIFDGDGSEAESIKNQITYYPRIIAEEGTGIDWRHHSHDFQNMAKYPLYHYANNGYFSSTHRNSPMPMYPNGGFPFHPSESTASDDGFVYFDDHYNTMKLGQRYDDKSKGTATSSNLPLKAVATIESPSKTVAVVQSPFIVIAFNGLPSKSTTATGSPSRTFPSTSAPSEKVTAGRTSSRPTTASNQQYNSVGR
ncbi:hypothetical protein BGZ49_004254, partial [Haplosporangium sp. Z 27]